MKNEWPSFSIVPDADGLPEARPRGQTLARFIWWNGEVVSAEKQSVHYYSNALHYGSAVFEGIRCYPTESGPALFRARDHVERLLVGARLYGMKLDYDADALVQACVEVSRQNHIIDGYLRPLAYFGEGPIDLKPKRACPVYVFIAVRELGTFLGEAALRNGVRLTVSSYLQVHRSMRPSQVKASGNYASVVLAAHEAMDRGFDDALMMNADGTVAAATGQNVFYVKDSVLITNDLSSNIVPGITRASILTLAADLGIETQIRSFTLDDLRLADEVFMTGTAAEVTPVAALDSVEYKTGRGTLGARLQQAYLRAVTGKDDKHSDWLTPVSK